MRREFGESEKRVPGKQVEMRVPQAKSVNKSNLALELIRIVRKKIYLTNFISFSNFIL